MTDLVGRTFGSSRRKFARPGVDARRCQLPRRDGHLVKPVGRMQRAVVHRQTAFDVQSAIRAVRDCGLPLSVRGGVSR